MPVSRRLLLAAAATGLVGLPGCTAAPQWRPIASDVEPQALATIDGETWVGTAGPGLRGDEVIDDTVSSRLNDLRQRLAG